MYQIIKNYCESDLENGLLLLDMPTGFGKTYEVIRYIYDASMDAANKDKKYFFITSLKKNLPRKEIEDWFAERGNQKEFNEKFLFVDSNTDCVVGNLSPSLIKDIPTEIKKTDECKIFLNEVELLQNKDTKSLNKPIISSINDNFSKRTEPAFRRMLQKMLKKEYLTVDKRICAIKTDKRWQWLGKLYPSVFIKDCQIVFMSVDKFLLPLNTIVEPSYMLYNSNLINEAVIFIDEFDATKKTLLNNTIKSGLKDKIDYVSLFQEIHSALHMKVFPTALTTPSQQRLNGQYKSQTLRSVIDGIREKADDIYKNYSLQYSHKTLNITDETSHNFLFQDHRFTSVLDNNKKYISVRSDKKAGINSIEFSDKKPDSDNNNINVMLGKLRGFVNWFQGGINILAINYMQRKMEMRKDGDEEFTIESAIRSVLGLFNLNRTYVDYITSQIIMSSHKVKGGLQSSNFDLSFYENGFRFYSFEDSDTHDMQSKIMMCSFQNTPEKILLRFCEKAKVLGISATATIPSAIGNYDLEYLETKMQNRYCHITQADKCRLKASFKESQKGYDNLNINVELIGSQINGQYSVKSWESVFNNTELGKCFFDKVELLLPNSYDKNNYCKERYVRIATAYKRFVLHNDIQSFLCVLTTYPKYGNPNMNLAFLEEIFEFISRYYANSQKDNYVVLNGEDFENQKEIVMNRLAKGEKLFVISVYQSIGAGQNLQYNIPKDVSRELIKINDRNKSKEKDFDAIYLDRPTNVLKRLDNNLAEEDFVNYLFQTEYLQESSEISAVEVKQLVRAAFNSYSSEKTTYPKVSNLYEKSSVKLLTTSTIIQALGRMCRTNMKRKNIYIYADSKIAENIDISVTENRMFNYEFLALCEKIKGTEKPPIMKSFENTAELVSARVNKYIKNVLYDNWTDERIKEWKELRGYVLRHPTVSKIEIDGNILAKNFYIPLPQTANKVYFNQKDDYSSVSVSFQKSSRTPFTVSAEDSQLNIMLFNSELRQFFVENHLATEFIPNEFIMSPPLWNNIYKGALGEMVGWYCFSKKIGVKLEDIEEPELFELFDYKVKNLPVYVDFKNWHETTDFSKEDTNRQIVEKAKKCDCKCVIVANIVTGKNHREKITEIGGVKIVTIPSLITTDGDIIEYNNKALELIRSCINEYTY